MRLRQVGFTLTETLVVIGIIALLAAITLAVYPRTQVTAGVTACKQRLSQIHMALEMYKSDHPGYTPLHENVDFPAEPMRRPDALLPYLKSPDMLYCPICPPCAKKKLMSSYVFTVLPEENSGLYKSAKAQFDDWFESPESDYPVIHCLVHDELHFYPSERHLAELLNPPYVVWINSKGAIKSGRFNVFRGHDIAHECAK